MLFADHKAFHLYRDIPLNRYPCMVYICQHDWGILMVNVTIYSIHTDPMGMLMLGPTAWLIQSSTELTGIKDDRPTREMVETTSIHLWRSL